MIELGRPIETGVFLFFFGPWPSEYRPRWRSLSLAKEQFIFSKEIIIDRMRSFRRLYIREFLV